MAQPTTFSGAKLLIKIGDGATPETFTAPCGLNTKGLNRSAETADSTVPDCDNPAAPAWTEREVVSLSWDASGSGTLASESVQLWETWHASGVARNILVEVHSGPSTGRKYTGAGLLTVFNLTGERGQKVQVEMTIQGTGPLTSAAL